MRGALTNPSRPLALKRLSDRRTVASQTPRVRAIAGMRVFGRAAQTISARSTVLVGSIRVCAKRLIVRFSALVSRQSVRTVGTGHLLQKALCYN